MKSVKVRGARTKHTNKRTLESDTQSLNTYPMAEDGVVSGSQKSNARVYFLYVSLAR